MNDIKVPYMPISSFDATEVSEKFPSEEEDEGQNKYLMTDDEDKLSDNVLLILIGMGMEKYVDLFKKERIQLDTFLQLNESDLQELGITDPKDREIIINNLNIHQTNNEMDIVTENHVDDLRIINNIYRHLLLMQGYCAYIELQMKKHKLTDYKINKEESACTYLKAFAQAALIQTQKMNEAIYDAQDCLIDKILKTYNLVLPKYLQKLLPKKKKKRTLFAIKLMSLIGFSSVFLLSVKYFLSRPK